MEVLGWAGVVTVIRTDVALTCGSVEAPARMTQMFGLTILWPPAFPDRSPPHHFILPMDVIAFHAEPCFQIICGRAWDWLGKVTGILPSFVSAVERMFPVFSEQLVISDKSRDKGIFSTLCVCLLPSL